jgi:WhiB family redox-sensing transcriptional regulator
MGPLPFMPNGTWTPCQIAPDMFDGLSAKRAEVRQGRVKRARALCAECVVMDECREWGVVNLEPWGMWGGLTYRDRLRERRKRGLPKVSNERTWEGLGDVG